MWNAHTPHVHIAPQQYHQQKAACVMLQRVKRSCEQTSNPLTTHILYIESSDV